MMRGSQSPAVMNRRADGINAWNDIVLESFSGSSVDATASEFPAELARCSIEELNFICVESQPSQVHRWATERPSGSSGIALLHLQDTGQGVNHQCGHSVPLAPGNGVLCNPDQQYTVDFKTPYRMFIVELPIRRIAGRRPMFDLEQDAGLGVNAHKSRMLLSLLRSAWSEFEFLGDDEDWRQCVSRAGVELALGALGGVSCPRPVGPSMELRRAVIEHIRCHIDDPNLRPSAIAAKFGVSRRTIQSVFEKMSTTPSAYILDERLRAAVEMLREGKGSRTITDVALSSGFSDSAYFSRCFHKKFGVPPRLYMKR
jgi:AraC-like DNA-binding protein